MLQCQSGYSWLSAINTRTGHISYVRVTAREREREFPFATPGTPSLISHQQQIEGES